MSETIRNDTIRIDKGALISINTEFEWRVYANATLAGLSELIPIPLVDLAFSRWFQQRIVTSIAKHRGYDLPNESVVMINQSRGCGCFGLLVTLPFELIKRIFRTVAYVFTIHAAAKSLSENWQRAFLLDHSMRRGHLDNWKEAQMTNKAIHETLKSQSVDPFLHLAREVIAQSKHTLRSMFLASREHVEDETVTAAKSRLNQGWAGIQNDLVTLAKQYDTTRRIVVEDSQLV